MAKKRRKSGSSSKRGIAGGVAAVIIIVLALVIISVMNSGNTGMTDEEITEEQLGSTEVAVLVNGESITQGDLDAEYSKLPAAVTSVITKEAYLDELINQKLLEQEAEKLNIVVEESEIQEVLDDVKLQNGITEEEMDTILQERGLSLESFKSDIEKQLLISKLYESVIDSEVNEEDVTELFNALTPVNVRHILLVSDINETEENFNARANELLERATEENFCELVTNNTVDVASIETCGEYLVVQNSNFVPEFEAAAFEMDVGEFRLVESQFGIHLMYKVEEVTLEDYRDELESQLQATADRDAIADYVDSLRENAEITFPSDNEITGNVIDEELIPIEEFEEEMNDEVVIVEETETLDEMPETVEETMETEEEMMSNADVTFVITGENYKFVMDGVDNPDLVVEKGQTVRIEFESTDGFHDVVIDEFNAATEKVQTDGTTYVEFVADTEGTFEYYCSVGSHREQGMYGNFIVLSDQPEVAEETEVIVEPEVIVEEEEPEQIIVEEEELQPEENEPVQEVNEPIDYAGSLSASQISCLENKDIVLYGAHWDSQTKLQLQMFPSTPSFYVECFEQDNFRNKKAECNNVQAFPTWRIDGQNIIGRLNIKTLQTFTGC